MSKNYKKKVQRMVQKFRKAGFQNICFWLPTYNLGGGTLYYHKLACYLLEHTSMQVYYMDYEDGYAAERYKDSGIVFLKYDENEKEFPIKEKTLIVVNSTRAIQLKRMHPENKILLWHYETTPCAWHLLYLLDEYLDFLQMCKEKNAMVFVDWASRNSIKKQYSNIQFENKSYLHICLPEKEVLQSPSAMIKDGEIHITWLGRVSAEKLQSIYYLIDNLANYKTNKKKILHIIGDGFKMGDLKKYITRYQGKIHFDLVGSIPPDKLDDYLKANTDILFAMGTSCVDGAALKIPTAVVLLDYKAIKSDLFFWLHDTQEYCVAVMPSQVKEFHINYSHFSDMLDDVFERGQKGALAEMSYQYYKEYFSNYDKLVYDFLTYIDNSELTMKELKKCIRYIPYNTIKVRQTEFLGRKMPKKVINRREFV